MSRLSQEAFSPATSAATLGKGGVLGRAQLTTIDSNSAHVIPAMLDSPVDKALGLALGTGPGAEVAGVPVATTSREQLTLKMRGNG